MRLVSFLYMFHPCHRRKRSAGGMEEGSKQMGFVLRNSFLVVALVLFLAVAVAAVPTGAVMAAANAYNGSFSMQGHPVEEEWALDSETSRRILQSNNQHISYRGLKQGMPAATPAASGLSYVRGCKKIYGCRGAIRGGKGMLELDERGDRAMGFVLRNSFLVVALVLFLAVAAAAAAVPAGAEMAAANAYNGSFSMQWHAAEEEWALDSETSRRILLYSSKSGHIDYNAIKDRNAPAVSAKSGQPYKRGCLKIYHCPGGQ